jgi:hypothetical protein
MEIQQWAAYSSLTANIQHPSGNWRRIGERRKERRKKRK